MGRDAVADCRGAIPRPAFAARIVEADQGDLPCPAPFAKIFPFQLDPNQHYIPRRPVPREGRFAIVTDAGRDAVDAGARHSLRLLNSEGGKLKAKLAHMGGEMAKLWLELTSLRGATRRSNPRHANSLDCFAEPVIGRRFAPTRWPAMTVHAPQDPGFRFAHSGLRLVRHRGCARCPSSHARQS